jgi:hypothetical protein
LKHLLYGRHKQSLMGDLIQLHQDGRSSRWYWRQVLTSLLAGFRDAARTHGISLAMSLCAAWGAILIWRELNTLFIRNSGDLYWFLRDALGSSGVALDGTNRVLVLVWLVGAFLRVLCFGVSGWLVARLHPRQQGIAIAALIVSLYVWTVPWQQIRVVVVAAELHPFTHYASALAGILIGGWLAMTRGSGRKLART